MARGQAIPQHQLAAPDHGVRVAEDQGDQAAPGAVSAGSLERLPAQEPGVALELAGEQQAGLDRVVVRGQLAAEGAVRLLQPQRLDGVVAGVDQAETVARGDQVLVGADGELGRHVQFPAKLADVGDPGGRDRGVGGAQPLQRAFGVRAGEKVLGEAGLVEQGDRGAGGALLRVRPGLPVLLAPAVHDVRVFAAGREVVGPLPAHLAAEARVGLLEQVIRG